jgi:hypothetical protein
MRVMQSSDHKSRIIQSKRRGGHNRRRSDIVRAGTDTVEWTAPHRPSPIESTLGGTNCSRTGEKFPGSDVAASNEPVASNFPVTVLRQYDDV